MDAGKKRMPASIWTRCHGRIAPWKDSAMERQEYMDAGSIKMEGSVKSGIFHTQEWRVI